MPDTITELTEPLLAQMQREKFVLLATIDAESGSPTSNAISWITAPDSRTLRFAVDQRSRLIANIKGNPKVTITVFASGTVHAIYGDARVVAEPLPEVPLKLSCIDIAIEAVRDAMFYGARISVEPEYEKTYDKRAAEKLDNQVFSAMTKA